MTKNKQQQGIVLLVSLIIITSVSLIIGLGLVFLSVDSTLVARNKLKSVQSYYAAVAGIEDSLLRIKNTDMQFPAANTLAVGASNVTLSKAGPIGGVINLVATANNDNRFRKLAVDCYISTAEVSFFYGAQAGEGGVIMDNNSKIEGNVFSNGSILPGGGGEGDITGTATVAGNGNKIKKVNIGQDAYVHTCDNSDIDGVLNYVSGGSIISCSYGSLVNMGPSEIEPIDLPITAQQIANWQAEAAAGGEIAGNYLLNGGASASLGPVKINGNLTIDNNSHLTLTGSIYVTGNIIIRNNSTVELDASYGTDSGLILSDGKMSLYNNVELEGSGQAESFMMMLSTNNSTNPLSPAIDLYNNAEGAIFYASDGTVYLHNNIEVREAIGYQLRLGNNAEIEYDVGLADVNFSSGPGGSWQILNWAEVE